MSFPPLSNYLRAYRKRLGLSRDDLAYLLGCRGGTNVSRYECFSRQPNHKTMAKCARILRVPVEQLFPGFFASVDSDIVRRAKLRLRHLARYPESPALRRRITGLKIVLGHAT